MSTTTIPAKPQRNNAAHETQVLPPSEPDDFGPIIELGPLEPQTPAQKLQTIANFKPSETLAEQILTDASNPRVPLHIIAAKAQTTIEALQAWLAKPEIAERLDNILLSIRQRSKLKLTHELDNVTEACATILERFNRAPDRGSTEDRRPDTELRASSIITRNASNALMASRVMLALAKYLDGPPKSQRRAQDPTAPKPNPAPAPDLDPALRLSAGALNKAIRLLPSLASIDLHDFREYLTSNHHKEPLASARGASAPIQSPRGNAGGAKAAQSPSSDSGQQPLADARGSVFPLPPTDNLTTSPPTSAPSAPRRSVRTTRTPCTCGPTPCPTCPSAATLLTIAGAAIPRSRDPTAPAR